MKIYLYLDGMADSEITEAMEQSILEWFETDKCNPQKTQFVNILNEDIAHDLPSKGEDDFGLFIETGKKADLKQPLAFLHLLAKEHKQEFVVGMFDAQSNNAENVCYFGYEEGRPDHHEIASYLGLRR